MESLVSQDRLNELRALDPDGGDATLRSIIDHYLAMAPQSLNMLRILASDGNLVQLKKEAHSLRSSSLNLGVAVIAALCLQVETAESAQDATHAINQLEEIFAGVKSALRATLAPADGSSLQLRQIIQLQKDIAMSTLPLVELMELICRKTQVITGAHGAVVEIAEGDEMVYRACSGSVSNSHGLRLKIESSLSGMAVRMNQVLYCKDSETDNRVDREACRKVRARSMICVPLSFDKKVVGVLKVLSDQVDHFNESEVNALKLIASLLSASIAQTAAREQVTSSERMFRAIVESSSDGIATSKDGVVIDVNAAFERLFGIKREEVVGRPALTFVSPESRTKARLHMSEGYEGAYEIFCLRRDGSTFEAEVTGKQVRIGDETVRITTVRDVTANKSIEQNLRTSERQAREAAASKSAFLANVSHEVRTPLNGILGMVSFMKDTVLSEEQLKYVSILEKSSDALLQIINDILDYSKIEARKLCLETSEFELRSAVRDVIAILQPSALKKELGLSTEFHGDGDWRVKGDPARISQILMNLVANAIKFTAQGRVEVVLRKTQERFRFIVRDTGMGISPDSQTILFAPFSQVDASNTRKLGGTGLGLSICKQLVDLMGGTIGVNSAEGVGSEFWFELPLSVVKGGELKIKPGAMIPITQYKLKILLAEDNSINALIARTMLERLGHTVSVVESGASAIDALEHTTFDLILMDCQMPVMDGFEATRQIRLSEKKWRSIPIIALTAYADGEDKQRCLSSGMNGHTSKPVMQEALAVEIDRVLGKD